ncbi:hypothetical protein ElyMa_005503300 [Elysia marginata]|uniref:Uncharacterized protein n=1 Tax=Elysia marginata TaxID=1093978 RepID=A0AAV4ETW4_9GAST|nr:hypothetical protein ElyMa_005503300 [Elysia marginata]
MKSRKRALVEKNEPPSEVIIKEVTEMASENQDFISAADTKAIRQAVYRERRKIYPTLPKSLMEAQESIEKISLAKRSSEEDREEPILFTQAIVVVLSTKILTWISCLPFEKDCMARKSASSSNSLMCLFFSIAVHAPPVFYAPQIVGQAFVLFCFLEGFLNVIPVEEFTVASLHVTNLFKISRKRVALCILPERCQVLVGMTQQRDSIQQRT